MRVLARSAALAALLACGGDGGSTGPFGGAHPVRSISIAVPARMLVGDTLTLSADVRDAEGAPVTGRALTWSSSNPSIATVSDSGRVTGMGPGTAEITASADGTTGSTQVLVAAVPVFGVAIVPPASAPIAGQTTPLAVVVTDRNGAPLTGRQVSWSSSAPIIGTVDQRGRLQALSPGTTTVVARSEGVADTLAVAVEAPAGSTPPTIGAITPAVLRPGQTAVIDGTEFLTAATTSVYVAGVPAAVLGATRTQLTIAVPVVGLPCQSALPTTVAVATVGGNVSMNHLLDVATARPLAVGESFVASASDGIACTELPADGSYVVSVFNANRSADLTARFALRGSSSGAVAWSGTTVPPLLEPSVAPEGERPLAVPGAREHLARLDDDVALVRRIGAPRPSARAPSLARNATAPVPLTVGQTTTLNFHFGSCAAANTTPVTARVVFVGTKSIALEDVASPLAGRIDADLIAMAREFDTLSYPLLLEFGDPLALDARTDANGRIVMLFTPSVNAAGSNVLGFVAACDLYAPAQDPSVAGSNQAEIFYARTVTDTTPGSTKLDGRDRWRRQMPATLIHEAKHITSYAERLARGASQLEEVWLEEATAQVASELFGRVVHGNAWRGDAGYAPALWCESRPLVAGCAGGVIAMTNHFAFLAKYLQSFESKSVLSGGEDPDIYGSAWLFTRWALDTYGGASERTFLRSLVQPSGVSRTQNLEAATGRPVPALLAEFSLMLATDDAAGAAAPFVEPSWNLPDVFAGYAELGTAPPVPLSIRESTDGAIAVTNRALKGGGAVLLRITPGTPGAPQLLELRASMFSPLNPSSGIGMGVLRVR
jgi:hypothetical protein